MPPLADGTERTRITLPDGSRPTFSLGTKDKEIAERKRAKLVAAVDRGEDLRAAARGADAPERVREYLPEWSARRRVGMATKERRAIELHALDDIRDMFMCDVRPRHIRSIILTLVQAGKKRATIREVRGALLRMFDAAVADEIIEHNPVRDVKLPTKHEVREVRKLRMILTDDEFTKFVGAPVDLEIRMLSLAARCEGGMRTGDLHAWDWTEIDLVEFAECTIPRCKTGEPQRLVVPLPLRPFIRAWWERAGQAAQRASVPRPTRKACRAGQAAVEQLREAPSA